MRAQGEFPKVSVCLDSYNYGRFLPEAIESVLAQRFEDFELIISDDRSTDDSFEIAQNYASRDRRIKVLRNAANLGMVRNRNVCLSHANGEYVKWLHADDCMASNDALGRMTGVLDANKSTSLAASARQLVDENSRKISVWSCFNEARALTGTGIVTRCLFEQRNLIGGPSAVMFRRRLATRGFDEDFFVMADLEMWFHLLEQGFFFYVDEPLCAIRQHAQQQTEKDKQSLAPALENRELLRRYLHKDYVQFRRWIWKYLEYDAVRRIVRRSRKLSTGRDRVSAAITEFGGWKKYRTQALRHRYREALLKVRRLYERHLRRSIRSVRRPRPLGINMAGFAQSVYGIGESSRAMWKAVQASGLPCGLVNVRSNVHRNYDLSVIDFAQRNPYRINLMTFSFDYSRRFYRDMGPRFFAGRYNIGLWYWEQEHFPRRWHGSFDYYDEIWAPSEFTRQSIAAVSPVPVRKITYPFQLDDLTTVSERSRFGLDEKDYVFLFTFDFYSTVHRKNPGAVIDAFREAFTPKDRAVLVLKSINASQHIAAREALGEQAKGIRVLFLDDHVSSTEMNALFAAADCYVSLHRSEGLGLGMAHAMYLGKPVIGTGYSGNLEFMNSGNSFLVDYEMTELEEDSGPYEKGTRWADPKIQHGAALMQWVYNNRIESEAIGRRASESIRATLDPAVTSEQIRRRVHELESEEAIRQTEPAILAAPRPVNLPLHF